MRSRKEHAIYLRFDDRSLYQAISTTGKSHAPVFEEGLELIGVKGLDLRFIVGRDILGPKKAAHALRAKKTLDPHYVIEDSAWR